MATWLCTACTTHNTNLQRVCSNVKCQLPAKSVGTSLLSTRDVRQLVQKRKLSDELDGLCTELSKDLGEDPTKAQTAPRPRPRPRTSKKKVRFADDVQLEDMDWLYEELVSSDFFKDLVTDA